MAQNSSQNTPSSEPESPLRRIPTIKAESETQTTGQIRVSSPTRKMDGNNGSEKNPSSSNIRKRRNLSKNRGQSARQREKTPEPGRLGYVPHEDTTTTDEEDNNPSRNSREVEADDNYEQMRKLIEAKASDKDEYDIDIEEIRESRMIAENARRRRSISPFAVLDKEESVGLERSGSFIDPRNKLLSTNYVLTPKDDLPLNRRNSLVINTNARKNSLVISLPSPSGDGSMFSPSTPPSPRRQVAMVYADEEEQPKLKSVEPEFLVQKPQSAKTLVKDTEINKETLKKVDSVTAKSGPTIVKKLKTEVEQIAKPQETPLEKNPTKKLIQPTKSDMGQINRKEIDVAKVPPVKPARSKSASRIGGRTSESEMSEDQYKINEDTLVKSSKEIRRRAAIPRRFIRDKSPKRSKSIAKVEDIMEVTATGMSKTSKEIIELLQKARGRSLSIPKEDLRIPPEYRDNSRRRLLQTPNKTPSTPKRNSSVVCPKTIQLISKKEILSGLAKAKLITSDSDMSRRSSGYIDASQSEYTSSCYSSSPSENECDFDLAKSTAELTRRLSLLSQELENKSDDADSKVKQPKEPELSKVIHRKKSEAKHSTSKSKEKSTNEENNIDKKTIIVKTKVTRLSLIKFMIGNFRTEWRKFIIDYNKDYIKIKNLMIRSFSNIIILVLLFGLGGITFKYLEGDFENAFKCGARNVKRDFIEALWRGSHYLREEDWKSMARTKMFEFENQLHTAHEAGVTSYSGRKSWNFINSVVYCITVITTIGYGDIAPSTTAGQVATIIYAIIGIPLFLILLADFGKLLTRTIKFFWAFVRRLYYYGTCRKVRRTVPMQEVMKGFNMVYAAVRRPSQMLGLDGQPDFSPENLQQPQKNPSAHHLTVPGSRPDEEIDIGTDEPETPAPSVFEIDDEFNLPISVALTILVIYIFLGAAVYSLTENWSFFEAFYFVFISMSTIGFGDYVPKHGIFMIASIVYLAFGLALTSMCINVVQEKLSDSFRQASAKIGATIGLKLAEEDGGLVPMTPQPIEIPSVHGDLSTEEKDGRRKNT